MLFYVNNLYAYKQAFIKRLFEIGIRIAFFCVLCPSLYGVYFFRKSIDTV